MEKISDMPSRSSDYIRSFYTKQFSPETEYEMPAFYRILKRFETHRVKAALNLVDGGERLLDVGCGSRGYLIGETIKKGLFREYYGVEISEENTASALNNIKKLEHPTEIDVKIITHDVNAGLPYPDSLFDTIVCIATLQYLFDPVFVLSEFRRCLKNDGTLILEVPNVAYLPGKIRLLFGRLPGVQYGQDELGNLLYTYHTFTMSSLSTLLKNCGFRIKVKTGSGIFAGVRRWWPSLLTGDLIVKCVKEK